jgi:hypothetical protein
MDLEQDSPETVEDEPAAPNEGGDGGEAAVEDRAPASERVSDPRAREDSTFAQRHVDAGREAEARYWREEAERNRRELEQLRAAQRPDPREEQARLEAMDPEQRITYIFEKQQRDSQNQVAGLELRTSAQIDRLKFDAELSRTAAELGWSSAKRAKLDAEVEQWYNSIANQAFQNGQPLLVSRVDLLDKKLGQEMRTNGAKAVKSAAATGKANTARQATKMTPASSNVTGKSSGMTKAQESIKLMVEAGVLDMS